jgi:hypothetical protein
MIAAMVRRVTGVLVVAAAAGAALLPVPAGLVERWFSRGWFPPAQRALTGVSNAVPFALLDALIITALAALAWQFVSVAGGPRGSRGRRLLDLAWRAALAVAVAYLAFVFLWGANYRREPITAWVDFDDRRVTADSVVALNETAIAEVARLRPRLPARLHDWPGRSQTAAGLLPALELSTRLLGLSAPVRAGLPKTSLLDPYLTRSGVSGMTDPFFLETILASNLLRCEEPAVLAHEWGHLAGLARESDASFFGLVVCLHGNETAQYSGWLEIFLHTLGARDRDGRLRARERLPASVRADLAAMAARSERDQVRVLSVAAWRAYDSYLRSNRVSSGVQNYGEVVRLLAGTRFEPGWAPILRQNPER